MVRATEGERQRVHGLGRWSCTTCRRIGSGSGKYHRHPPVRSHEEGEEKEDGERGGARHDGTSGGKEQGCGYDILSTMSCRWRCMVCLCMCVELVHSFIHSSNHHAFSSLARATCFASSLLFKRNFPLFTPLFLFMCLSLSSPISRAGQYFHRGGDDTSEIRWGNESGTDAPLV